MQDKISIMTLALAKKFATQLALGNYTNVKTEGDKVIFTLINGTTVTATVPHPKDAVSVESVDIINGELIFKFSDSSIHNAGYIVWNGTHDEYEEIKHTLHKGTIISFSDNVYTDDEPSISLYTKGDNDTLIPVAHYNLDLIDDNKISNHTTFSSQEILNMIRNVDSKENWTQYTTEITNANDFCAKGKNSFATLFGGYCSNLPENNRWFMVEWHGADIGLSQNGYGFQIARTVGASIQGKTYIRYKNQNDSWTNWQKVPQINPNDSVVVATNDSPKLEFGLCTTSGETRTVTLKNNYSDMKYFDVQFANFNALPIRDVNFIAPNKVTFKINDAWGNSFTTNIMLKYMFVGVI